ncbi:DivIVA domain-containing protein [Sanguibacter sp. A247]|uniref:DivIVA domain-containing protein n=1 Tax=unclassified Sanguibacter TaxID=2645534 RepID=UPI003FD6FC81
MLTAADVRSARFTATKFRSGYEIVEVDEFLARSARTLEHLEQGLTVEADGTPLLTPADLLGARFSPTHLTEGYFVDEVDDLLDGIIDALNTYIGRAERGEPLVQPMPSAHDAAGVAEDEPVGAGAVDGTDAELDDTGAESAAPADDEVAPSSADVAPSDDEVAPSGDTLSDGFAAFEDHVAEAGAADALTSDAFSADTPSDDTFPGTFPAEPVWAPPVSTAVTPSPWEAPAPTVVTPLEPAAAADDETRSFDDAALATDDAFDREPAPDTALTFESVDVLSTEPALDGEPGLGTAPEPDGEPAPADGDDWVQPTEQTSPWAPPEATRWTAPTSGAEAVDETGDVDELADTGDVAAGEDAAGVDAGDDVAADEDAAGGIAAGEDGAGGFAAGDVAANGVAADGVAASEAPAPWEPGFVPPATPIATPDWGFTAPAALTNDEWSAPTEPAAADASVDAPEPVAVDEAPLLSLTDESPWASLDGDEPVALDLEEEVRDAERADSELPAWLTDAQPEMAQAAPEVTTEGSLAPETTDGAPLLIDEPAGETPTRVSAFALAAQSSLPEPAAAPAEPAAAPEAAAAPAEPDAATAALPVEAPAPSPAAYVAPADALDSQGFLRQLTFARATSTGPAKDSITLVGPDGTVYSAVNVRKTAEGLVVDLG